MEGRQSITTSNASKTANRGPSMILTNLLFLVLILLLITNLAIGVLPFQRYETEVVYCESVASYAKQGWRVVAAYSYSTGDAYSGYTVWNECVIERPMSILSMNGLK